MTDIHIDFEDPPPIARRSDHLPLLLALKAHPGQSARVQKDVALSESDAAKLATALKGAARKIGDGYKVVSRFIPAADRYGVWATYEATEGDEPPPFVPPAPITEAEALEQAQTLVREAIPVRSEPVDDEWELPEVPA